MNDYQTFLAKSRYARWDYDLKRREEWSETVDRYISYFSARAQEHLGREIFEELREAITHMDLMPSMRCLMTAGKALDRDQAAGFNCSFIVVDDPKAFDEAMYLSMNGCGVGFSVERQFVSQLPVVAEAFYPTDTVIQVRDSRIGWASATRQLISLLYCGLIPKWDLSKLRPAGAILKTFGGRSSGSVPLDRLFKFLVVTFQKAAGRKLQSIECHDIMCYIGKIVQCGGVRRSAMISLSNLSDERMRLAKSGGWTVDNIQRAMANNSAAYTEKPELSAFIREMLALYESKSGERGIFNRYGANKHTAKFGRREYKDIEFGTNPCFEIILRSCEFCNLSEVVVRYDDTKESLKRKIKLATILGTLQSTLTDFRYIRKEWKKNTDEERLLGVSLTGITDNKFTAFPSKELEDFLDEMREYTISVNKEYSDLLGINSSVAITCVKPSGTVAQLVGCSPGIHTSPNFIKRAVREDRKNPICQFLIDQGIPNEPDVTAPNDVHVFYFPIKTTCVVGDRTAIEQLEMYLMYKKHWTEHNVSITVTVKESEWMDVFAWVWDHFDDVNGISFLPAVDHIYNQQPIKEISEEEYNTMVYNSKKINWDNLSSYESEDYTEGVQEPACSGGQCSL